MLENGWRRVLITVLVLALSVTNPVLSVLAFNESGLTEGAGDAADGTEDGETDVFEDQDQDNSNGTSDGEKPGEESDHDEGAEEIIGEGNEEDGSDVSQETYITPPGLSDISDCETVISATPSIKDESEKADPELKFAHTVVKKWVGEDLFINRLSKKTDGTVIFTSQNTDVATVDETDGEVTICGVGQTVIMAVAAESEKYLAGTAEYMLTVTDERIDISKNTDPNRPAGTIPKVTIGGVSISYGYSGKAYAPKITLTVNGQTLVLGIDYTVRYSNNVNPGTATITITGQGKYTGTRIKTFQIVDCVSRLVSGKVYQLIPKNNSETAVCPFSGRTEINTKLYITNRSTSKAMQFKAVRNADDTWKFVNIKSKKVLAVKMNSVKAGAEIVLYDSTERPAQNWKLSGKSDNSFAIINSVTDFSITMSDSSAVKGTTLKMGKTESSGLQRFYFSEVADTGSSSKKDSDGTSDHTTDGVIEPTLKLYGVLGKVGQKRLQSVAASGDYIYCYSGTSGRFFRVDKKTHTYKTFKMPSGREIIKGNGMTSDGMNLYLSGNDKKIYTIPISQFSKSGSVNYTKAVNVGVFMNGLCYDYSGSVLYGYHNNNVEGILEFYKIDLSASKNRVNKVFKVSWAEAVRYDQDMEIFDGAFYIVSDYPGTMVKISKKGKVLKNYRLSQYADSGIYTGEFEGVCKLGSRLLLASTYKGYSPEDVQFPAVDTVNPEDGVTLRQSAASVLTMIDPVRDLTGYDPYMRGAVAAQKAVVHVNFQKNTWRPVGTTDNPFPSPMTAFNARKNPRYNYVFQIDKPELDVNNKPFMIIANQRDVTIDLTAACSTSDGIMSLYISNSRITLKSAAKFRISYLIDSEVNYISDPKYCTSVRNYNLGNGTSRFNSSGKMVNAFGKKGSTPNGNYVYSRQLGSDSGLPVTLTDANTVMFPPGKTIQMTVKLVGSDEVFTCNGMGDREATMLPLIGSSGQFLLMGFRYNPSTGMLYLSKIRKVMAIQDEKAIQSIKLNVNMA